MKSHGLLQSRRVGQTVLYRLSPERETVSCPLLESSDGDIETNHEHVKQMEAQHE
jgi:hypothetical protein